MKNENIKNSRTANLYKAKVKDLGFWEKISLKIAGFMDGVRGLPREDDKGNWLSPYIDKEIRSYDEFSSRMFGQLQIEEEENYARLGKLMDSIEHIKMQLESAKSNLDEVLENEGTVDISRKHGEDKLTDAQVAARRSSEREKRIAPFKSRLISLQSQLTSEINEFIRLRNKIIEDNNSTRMICNRVKDHLHMRIDTYWNAVLRKHPNNSMVPVVSAVEVSSRAEEVYMEPHRGLMQKAELLKQTLSSVEGGN